MQRPRTGFRYLDDVPAGTVIAMAHRGGSLHPDLIGQENTLNAFDHAVRLGFRYLETDVHLSRDGQLVAFHDDVLDRTTDSSGAVADRTADELSGILVAGEHPVPLLADLLEEFPECRFNIDLKAEGTGEVLADLLAATGAEDRVCVGSFGHARLGDFRRRTGGRVATAASPAEVVAYLTCPGRAARLLTGGTVAALQVPRRRGRVPLVTPSFVRHAHRGGAHVHVWTVDEPDEMHALLDLGVDGLITDRTDVLRDVLVERGSWVAS